jgi:hypothetical protein
MNSGPAFNPAAIADSGRRHDASSVLDATADDATTSTTFTGTFSGLNSGAPARDFLPAERFRGICPSKGGRS